MASAHRRAGFRLYGTHACVLILLSASTLLLSACGNFFSCEGKASCPTTCVASSTVTCPPTGTGTGTGSSTDDYAYVANSATSATDIDSYNLGSGSLTAVSGSPLSFDYSPTAMVVTPADTFLYAASDSELNTTNPGAGFIYGYSLGTGGAISILDSGTPLESESVTSLAVSPDGNWLFCLDTDGITLEEYSIDTSTGALTYENTYGITGATGTQVLPSSVAIAPSGDYLVVTLGTGGAETFSFNTTTGVAASTTLLSPANTATGIFAAAIDANNYLYLAGTDGLTVYSTTTAGVPTLLKTYSTGNGSHSVVINNASTYVYVGNESDGTISGFSIGTNAALTALAGSPYTGPTTVDALALDSTDAYLIASGYNASTGIQLFSIGSAGALSSVGTAGTGTSALIPGAIATTH
jgi:6-phosphogluconolactonase (cycloisomerase 2 family)